MIYFLADFETFNAAYFFAFIIDSKRYCNVIEVHTNAKTCGKCPMKGRISLFSMYGVASKSARLMHRGH